MTKKMLIDAASVQETRVAVVDSGVIEEFDYEVSSKKALKGNIYLAKVTRVEPSLQACFVEYGGNRHGFLPFSDIHPDYFRIPVSDRQAFEQARDEALKKAQEEQEEAEKQEEEKEESTPETQEESASGEKNKDDDVEKKPESEADGDIASESGDEPKEEAKAEPKPQRRRRGRRQSNRMSARSKDVEILGGDNAYEDEIAFRFDLRKQYKIQEVVQRGQVLLVQASKEERGNKGAAVTTYLSLPGRYCVLMPNSPRGGGVSRKIATHKDRNRMRDLLKELAVPSGMSVILRTAGVARTKAEVKRDLDYLMRLWDDLREITLQSTAPAVVYEEGDLIKRSIRDLYTKDIDEIIVAGEQGHQTARKFMKMMIPSHLKKITFYEEVGSLFAKYGIEDRVSDMSNPEVRLKSGGSIVINPTEALVAIDVNSGKANKSRHIEETAVKTNLEAADEIAKQLRLRDLGGLIVVDFIDMDERRNNADVERRIKAALSGDRARIQVGRISSFGLLELSRQRMNPSLAEVQFDMCQACNGTGKIKSARAVSFSLLRDIESKAVKSKEDANITAKVTSSIALNLLNNYRQEISQIEKDHKVRISIEIDPSIAQSEFKVLAKDTAARDSDKRNNDSEEQPEKRRSKRGGRNRNKKNKDKEEVAKEAPPKEPAPEKATSEKPTKKVAPAPKAKEKEEAKSKGDAPKAQSSSADYEVVTSDDKPSKKKRGWWNKLID